MTISQTSIDQAKQTNLISIAERYTTLRKESSKEFAGPCPRCGGSDRFHVKPDAWFCRHCHPKWGDQIEFIRWADGTDFTTAIERLTGQRAMNTVMQVRTPVKPTVTHVKPEGWLEKATAIVERAHAALVSGGPGADYLDGRSIEPHAWVEFKLGYAEKASLPGTEGRQRAPAIVIPWYRRGQLIAVRYRFLQSHEYADLDGKPCKAKQTALKDSDFAGILYGGQALLGCAEDLRTLVLCEGELNAISTWQTCHEWKFDVLSLGSESAKLTQPMIDYARKFSRVIVWMDNADVAKATRAAIPGAWGISSPDIDGRKHDANDMLQSHLLGGLLATARFQACESNAERERLLWDIWDTAQLPGGIDDGTRQVMESIAKGLGRTL